MIQIINWNSKSIRESKKDKVLSICYLLILMYEGTLDVIYTEPLPKEISGFEIISVKEKRIAKGNYKTTERPMWARLNVINKIN